MSFNISNSASINEDTSIFDVTTKPCKRVLTFNFIFSKRKFYLSLPSMFFRIHVYKDRTRRLYVLNCQCYMVDKDNNLRRFLLPNVLPNDTLCTQNFTEKLRQNPAVQLYFSGAEDPFDKHQLVEMFLSDFWNSAFDPKVRPDILLKHFNVPEYSYYKKMSDILSLANYSNLNQSELHHLTKLSLISDLYENWENQTKLNSHYDVFLEHLVDKLTLN